MSNMVHTFDCEKSIVIARRMHPASYTINRFVLQQSMQSECARQLQDYSVAMPCPGASTTGPVDSCPCQAGFDDVTNFMDGSPPSCLLHFTCGQARRMHAMYWHYRAPTNKSALRSMVEAARYNQLLGVPADAGLQLTAMWRRRRSHIKFDCPTL